MKNVLKNVMTGVFLLLILGVMPDTTSLYAQQEGPQWRQKATVADSYRPTTIDVPERGNILIITDQDYNDTELFYPLYRFVEEGFHVTVASLNGGEIKGYNSAPLKTSVPISEVNAAQYDALYLPGGHAPGKLRENEQVLGIVKYFYEAEKPIAAICHGPQILASAGLLNGKEVTAWPGLEDEMREAGAIFRDVPVVETWNLVTARMPGDLPAHLHAFLVMIARQ
jgi:protease I